MMNLDSRIYVSGSSGLIGSALVSLMKRSGFTNILTSTRKDAIYPVDLRNYQHVSWWFSCVQPEYVIHCAARVGGVQANKEDPIGFFLDNMLMEMNVLSTAHRYGVKKLLFLGSSCVYPMGAETPIKESALLTGPFQPEVEAYGLAKVSGIKLCQWYRQKFGQNFISAMPCNIYGPNDNPDAASSHVIPGLLTRMHNARVSGSPMKVWGDGTAKRELLYSEDLAEALLLIMQEYDDAEPINAGSGQEWSIREVAEACAKVVGYPAELLFDDKAVTGAHHKCMDNTKLFNLGWKPRTSFQDGLKKTYESLLPKLPAIRA